MVPGTAEQQSGFMQVPNCVGYAYDNIECDERVNVITKTIEMIFLKTFFFIIWSPLICCPDYF
jgi:hypothetical protein